MLTIRSVPIEEIFFFIIQSIFTSQLYILLGLFETPSQHLLFPTDTLARKTLRWAPAGLLIAAGISGWKIAVPETHTFYLGCIGWWITPVMLFLWTIAGDHFLSRSRTSLLTIIIPTLYLCMVDTIALRGGTWHITERTSTGVFVWNDLPLEEAVFFTVTNTLLVLGMSAFERSFAVIDVFGDLLAKQSTSAQQSTKPTVSQPKEFVEFLIRSLLLRVFHLSSSHRARIPAFEKTQEVLAVHSRSFHTASYIFPSAVRRDLVILYAFCRVLDDFCDESATKEEAISLISMSKEWLDLLYPSIPSSQLGDGKTNGYVAPAQPPSAYAISAFLHKRVPVEAQSAFFLLSTISSRIPRYPFDDLIAGYEWDLEGESRPIVTQADLVEYSRLVASSVAEMCVWAMWANEGMLEDEEERKRVLDRAASMGVSLQITNISRDIREDAGKGRIYIPQDWFKQESSMYGGEKESSLRLQDYANLQKAAKEKREPTSAEFRYPIYIRQMLDLAEEHKIGTSEAIRKLPRSCQAGIRAATRVYIGIGAEISKKAFLQDGRTPNPQYQGQRVSLTKWQRIAIALKEVYTRR
jgi:15-cis-phytoene synthase/lycopene beta-cyclase